MSAEDYTSPERCAEVTAAKRQRAAMLRKGACFFCKHRVQGFGLAACSTFGRTFPLCAADGLSPAFELDPTTMDAMERSR